MNIYLMMCWRQIDVEFISSVYTVGRDKVVQCTIRDMDKFRGVKGGNDELRLAQVELKNAKARYLDLYDMAPVGYYTVSDPNGRVFLRLTKEKDEALISVIDEGKGIEPEFVPSLFRPLMQKEQSIDRSAGGLGLGLPNDKFLYNRRKLIVNMI